MITTDAPAAADPATAAMMARAFVGDPAMAYIYPDRAGRARRLPALFRLQLRLDRGEGRVLQTPGGEAATLWLPPGHVAPGPLKMLREAPALWAALGWNVARGLRVSSAIEKHLPREPHWYLHFAACDPAHHGKGHGGRAIRAGLALADHDRVPAWLETATPANVPLYRSLGFVEQVSFEVPGGGPRFVGMMRPVQ